MSAFSGIVGHQREVARLETLLAGSRLAHAYLFSGDAGIGKFRVALATGAARLGVTPDRLVDDPDAFVIDDADDASLSIDRIRELIDVAARRPVRGPGRVFIVRDAERLTEEGQNALLKTLEEPPASSLTLLVCARPEGLLPTIRSRAQTIRFRPLDGAATRSVLEAEGVESAALLASLAHGSPGNAMILAHAGLLERRGILLDWWTGRDADPLGTAEALYVELKGKDAGVRRRTRLVVELWVTLLRDLAIAAAGAPEIVWNRDLLDEITDAAAGRDLEATTAALAHAVACLGSLHVYASPELVLTDLALELAGRKPRGRFDPVVGR